jgi:hypothetical protein
MRPALLLLLGLSACSTVPAGSPPMGEPLPTCRNEGLGAFTGQPATQELGARMLATTGARDLRWVAHGMMVTMDFRADRLTVYLDAANRVERAGCG